MSQTINELRSLQRRQGDLRSRLKAQLLRTETARDRIVASLVSLSDQATKAPATAEHLANRLEELAGDRLDKIGQRLDALSKYANDRAVEIENVDLTTLADTVEQRGASFESKATMLAENALNEVVVSAISNMRTEIATECDKLEAAWDESSTQFQGAAEEWSTQLEELKTVLEERLDELTQVEIQALWQKTGAELEAQLEDKVAQIIERARIIRSKVEQTLEGISKIVGVFSESRRITKKATAGAGTGLEAVASIFNDLQDILESVT